ncbi:MAG: hypothetical protein WCP20_02035 [Desulfuromonadales bacterium]
MKKLRVYVDTSVIGGCLDDEFKEWSNGLLLDFQNGIFLPVLSVLTEAEIADAPKKVQDVYNQFRAYCHQLIPLDEESIELARHYLNRGIVTPKYLEDAQHIAIATVVGADMVVSWNFRHIVHFDKINRFNAVNIELGYKTIAIYSPREVTCYGNQVS